MDNDLKSEFCTALKKILVENNFGGFVNNPPNLVLAKIYFPQGKIRSRAVGTQIHAGCLRQCREKGLPNLTRTAQTKDSIWLMHTRALCCAMDRQFSIQKERDTCESV